MDDIKEMWGAYIFFPTECEENIEFSYSAMEIKERYQLFIETKHFYFISGCKSTKFFDRSMFEQEYKISDFITTFYSSSKDKCIEWLNKKREDLIHDYKLNYERLLKSEIKEKQNHNECPF